MTHVIVDEGQYVADLIYGRGDNARSTAPEPSLLPHLGAFLCHGETIEEVLRAAWEFAAQGGMSPPWMPLWEATLWGVAGRADIAGSLNSLNIVTANHWHVLRTLRRRDLHEAEALAKKRIAIGPQYPTAAGAARLAPVLSRLELDGLLADPLIDPATLDAESVRSLLAAAQNHDIELGDDWVDAATKGYSLSVPPEWRQAHVLPYLPSARRAAIADSLASRVTQLNLPPDMRALWVSRIAPFVSSSNIWDTADLLEDLEPVWREHIEWLLTEPWPAEPWHDVFRAHPDCDEFRNVARPHETTVGVPGDVRDRWQAHRAMAPDRSVDMADTGGFEEMVDVTSPPTRGGPGGTRRPPPPIAAPPDTVPAPPIPDEPTSGETPPMEPRRLQADVLLEDSMQDVTAFVANNTHVIDVSIGRGGRIRASADIEGDIQKELEKTDKDWIVLPVWFHAPGQNQSGKLRVPRDQAKNSTVESFSYTVPVVGRVLARIHVMRPGGGKLLQSAILAGDIVATPAEAEAHDPGIELNVDVVAGNLFDPPSGEQGETLIADENTALREQDGSFVEIDVSQLQSYLVRLVHEIETAADRHELDDKAVAKKLVTLARAGQQLRSTFEPQLGRLADASPLQIVSLQGGDILPLELVYDGPALSLSSEICPTWQKALREGSCKQCDGGGPDNDEAPARVCPMRFWSMHKVIERRTKDTNNGRFHVAAERSAGRPRLRPIDVAVVAASGRVAADDVSDLRDFAVTSLNVPARTAANWAEWMDVIRIYHPELLIAMPHNQAVDGGITSALMMGEPPDDATTALDEAALLLGSVSAAHVQLCDDRPGPIVLLLGCNTQFQEGQLAGFAGEFRQNGAALTVSTLGELRADQAPRAAHELLERIVRPPRHATTVGEVLLATRQHLLGDGMIMALLLVANGDAEWLLPQQGSTDDENT